MSTSVWLFKPRSHGRKREGARARNGAPLYDLEKKCINYQYSISGMVFWAPGAFFRPFPCHPRYTIEVGVPIRRLKILAKFALLLQTRACAPRCSAVTPHRRSRHRATEIAAARLRDMPRDHPTVRPCVASHLRNTCSNNTHGGRPTRHPAHLATRAFTRVAALLRPLLADAEKKFLRFLLI